VSAAQVNFLVQVTIRIGNVGLPPGGMGGRVTLARKQSRQEPFWTVRTGSVVAHESAAGDRKNWWAPGQLPHAPLH